MRSLQDISVQFLKGVGPAKNKLLNNLGIETIEDLLYLFPRRYEDRRHLVPLNQVKANEVHTVTGTVLALGGHRSWYSKKHLFEIAIEDSTGRLVCVWFNQPYLENYLKAGLSVVLHGKVEVYKNRLQMIAPEYELINPEDASLSMGRIVPIYPLTRGVSQRYLRKIIAVALEKYSEQLGEVLPEDIREKYGLFKIAESVHQIHFPDSTEIQQQSYKRIAFEEFFFFQLSALLRRLSFVQKEGVAHFVNSEFLSKFAKLFPFALTNAQKRVILEIANDMRRPTPMLRLLQGDVGSGKTLVAFAGCLMAIVNGYQSALMAPTEILARQHFERLSTMASAWSSQPIRIRLLTSLLKKKEKEILLKEVKEGNVDLLIGTHALLQGEVQFKRLSFIVIDEQHKFGIKQRSLLSDKGLNPDVLLMTATPIPRTLCLTLYGDLDVSTLDEIPPGRGKIETRMSLEDKADHVYALVRSLVKTGRQAFIVYPLVDESEKLDLKAAKDQYEHFKNVEFKDLKLGLIHGKMKRTDAHKMMDQFKQKEIDILVATTVVEVGVDVPNASVMVIEHAQRFGLAQLHQLRGRVGRGSHESLCLLIAAPNNEEALLRLKAFVSTTDGFKIAQADLEIRGPGQFFGRHQHGLNELKIANPATQLDILELARQEAIEIIKRDPGLAKKENPSLRRVVEKRFPGYLDMVPAG